MRVYKEYPRPFLLEETKLTSIVNKIHEQLDDHPGTIRADQFDVFLPRNRTQQASSVEEVLRLENSRDYLCYYDGSDGSVTKTIVGIEGPAAYSATWWDPRNTATNPGICCNSWNCRSCDPLCEDAPWSTLTPQQAFQSSQLPVSRSAAVVLSSATPTLIGGCERGDIRTLVCLPPPNDWRCLLAPACGSSAGMRSEPSE